MKKSELFSLPIPQKTQSYAPVSHQAIDNLVLEEIDKRGLTIESEWLNPNKDGNIVVGYYDLSAENGTFGYRVAWQNSYNKQRPVAFVAGTQVLICSNGLMLGDTKFVRRHTGTVAQELKARVGEAFVELDHLLAESIELAEQMKSVQIDKMATAELCGRMLMEHEILTTSQLTIIRNEYKNPTYGEAFQDGSFWELYNYATHALKKSHPYDYIEKHRKLQEFAEAEILA